MARPLHDPAVLHALSEGEPCPARDWAYARLALHEPEAFHTLPDDELAADVCMAVAPPGLCPALERALSRGPCSPQLASAVATLGSYGALPLEPDALADAVRAAMSGDGVPADLWLAVALRSLDRLTAADLAAAARVASPDRSWALPTLVLAVAEQAGRTEEAAAEVAGQLGADLSRDPAALFGLLGALGTPTFPIAPRAEPADAAAFGAEQVQGTIDVEVRARGSRRRRLQQWVLALLEGVAGPAPAVLRALSRADALHHAAFVASAAWLRAAAEAPPADELSWVLDRWGGHDDARLSAARRALTPEASPRVTAALDRALPGDPVVALVPPLLRAQSGAELAAGAIALYARAPVAELRPETVACVAAALHPDTVPPLLSDAHTRSAALVLARWTQTEEVLSALLSLPLPARPEDRISLAWALAAAGDAAAIGPLQQVAQADEPDVHAGALALAGSLLGTRL